MRFKHDYLAKEFQNISVFLRIMAEDLDKFSQTHFQKELTITRIQSDKVKGESGVHTDNRAIDFRDQYMENYLFRPAEREILLKYINEKYQRNDGYKSLIWHSFGNGPYHFHLQIAKTVKTYEKQPKKIGVMAWLLNQLSRQA